MLSAEAWMLIGAGVIACMLVLARSWQGARRRIVKLEAEASTLAMKSEKLGSDLSKEARARTRLSEELASLRKRADKTKRRKAKPADQPLGTAQRIRDHEDEVTRVGLERDRANTECEALARTVADLERQLATSARALEQATASAQAPVASQVEAPAESVLDESRGELASTLERVSKLESELGIARQTEARMRKRMNNQEVLYASVRAELDVKKDRLRTQEEQLQRLQALKVAVID